MIVIEGPDFVGKTTLAKKLVQAATYSQRLLYYRHLSYLPEAFDTYWNYIPIMQRSVVLDRFFESRDAYGTVLNNQKLCDPIEKRFLYHKAALFGAVHVLLYVNNPEKWYLVDQNDKYNKDEQMYSLENNIGVANFFSKQHYSEITIFRDVQKDGFPDTQFIENILEVWIRNQVALDVVLSRRPTLDRSL